MSNRQIQKYKLFTEGYASAVKMPLAQIHTNFVSPTTKAKETCKTNSCRINSTPINILNKMSESYFLVSLAPVYDFARSYISTSLHADVTDF